MAIPNYNNLGGKVSTRLVSFADLAHRAWGAEWSAPDHGIYEFNDGRRKFDSTDRGKTGIYGVAVSDPLVLDGHPYPDMRVAVEVSPAPGFDTLNQIYPWGYHDEIGSEPGTNFNTNIDPARQYPK